MQQQEGVLDCPRCTAPVTAWRGHMLPLFELDPFDPYRLHRCDPLVLATLRQAAAMERLADVTADRNALRAAMTMPEQLPEGAPRRLAVVRSEVEAGPQLVDELRL